MKQVFEGWRGFVSEEQEITSNNLGHNLSMLADSMVGGKILRTWPLNYIRDMRQNLAVDGVIELQNRSIDFPDIEPIVQKIQNYFASDAVAVYEDENVLADVASQIPGFADTQFVKRAGQGAYGSVWVLGYPRQGQLLKIGVERTMSVSRGWERSDHEKDFYKELYLKQQTGKASQQDLPVYEYVDIVPKYFEAIKKTGEELQQFVDEINEVMGEPRPGYPGIFIALGEVARQFQTKELPARIYAVEIGEVIVMKDKMEQMALDMFPPRADEKEKEDIQTIAKFFGEEVADGYGRFRLYLIGRGGEADSGALGRAWRERKIRSIKNFKTYEDYASHLASIGLDFDKEIEDFVGQAIYETLTMIKKRHSWEKDDPDYIGEIDGMSPREYFSRNVSQKYAKVYHKIYRDIIKEVFRLAKQFGDDFLFQNRTQDIHPGNFGYSPQTGKVVVFDP